MRLVSEKPPTHWPCALRKYEDEAEKVLQLRGVQPEPAEERTKGKLEGRGGREKEGWLEKGTFIVGLKDV